MARPAPLRPATPHPATPPQSGAARSDLHFPAAAQQELARRRLTVRGAARAHGGAGDRPTRARGAGLDFADHRPYQPGDDIRTLDAAVTARTGRPVVREYVVTGQLPVLVVLDAGPSQRLHPRKWRLTQGLAAALAFTALSGGDRVQVVTVGDGVRASGWMQGVNRAAHLLGFLGAARPGGRGTLSGALRHPATRVPRGTLTAIVSDFLHEHDPAALATLPARGQEVLAAQVLDPLDLDPAGLGRGVTRLLDPRSDEELTVTLDDAACGAYREALAGWTAALGTQVTRAGGRWLSVAADQPLERVILRDLLGRGVIR